MRLDYVSTPLLHAATNAATTAAAAYAIGVVPVGGAVLGAVCYLNERMFYASQCRAGLSEDFISSNAVKVTMFFLRTLSNCALLYFAANAVGFAITFQAMVLMCGLGFIGSAGIIAIARWIGQPRNPPPTSTASSLPNGCPDSNPLPPASSVSTPPASSVQT